MLPRCWRNHQEVGCNNTYLAGPLGSNMRPSLCNACTSYCSEQRSSAGRSLQSLLRESLPNEATRLRGGPTVYCKTTRVLEMLANPQTRKRARHSTTSLQSLLRQSLPNEATRLRGGPTVYCKTTRVLGMPANPQTRKRARHSKSTDTQAGKAQHEIATIVASRVFAK